MDLMTTLIVAILIFLVAALYSSVGHGGASGYLAVMSFFAVAPALMSTTALLLNILVAGIAFVVYTRAGHTSFRLAWPFLLGSIPMSFVGGALRVSDRTYFLLLALALLFAAVRLSWNTKRANEGTRPPQFLGAAATGGAIGILSGIVGVGGGIFLSPVMLLLGWATVKQTAAVSAFFIVVNSIAGLAGRAVRGGLEVGSMWPFVAAAFAGGMIGSTLGANRFSNLLLRRLLALVLVLASGKLILFVVAR